MAVNFFFSFIIGQFFLDMLCGMKEFVYVFFASWLVVMTLFVILFLPETRGIPIEEM